MKKYDDGYALVLVVVVMAVLMLVALSVLSLSLRNLQSQQASIERMQAKYAAQGKVEIIQTELEVLNDLTDHANIEGAVTTAIGTGELHQNGGGEYFVWTGNQCEFTFDITASNPDNTASCTITCTIQLTEDNGAVKVTYTSYTISTETIGGDA